MSSESSEPDEPEETDVAWHREMDRLLEQWDDEPTHEKWRRGVKWR